jgi:hypothetical protein
MSAPEAQQLYAAVNELSAVTAKRDETYQELFAKLATRVNDQEAKIHRLESEKKKLWDRLQKSSEFLQTTIDEKVNGAIDAFNRRADQQDAYMKDKFEEVLYELDEDKKARMRIPGGAYGGPKFPHQGREESVFSGMLANGANRGGR